EIARQIRNRGPEHASGGAEQRDRVLIGLAVLAVLSRVIWVLWVHPPKDHVFSDMAHYVHRARLVASWEIAPGDRAMAWQAWGTHALLAVPMILLGSTGESALELAGLCWAGFSAGTVVLGYRLATRVLPRGREHGPHWPATAVGVVLLLWFPLLSHTGFFISETPYTCALLATTYGIVVLIQTGRGAVRAGLWGALAFALRPQVAVFFALLGIVWLIDRRRQRWSRHVDLHAALRFAIPVLVVLAISLVRTRIYTGELGGVAENGTMNLTAARCHNIVTRSFPDQASLESAQATGEPPATRRISLPGFRALAREGPDHPLALRPALGGESIDLVGYIGDRRIHREIRRRCYAATGIGGQLRYSITNVALAWVVARPWPESSDHAAPELLPVAVRGRDIAAWLAPLGLLGMLLALWRWVSLADGDGGCLAGLGVCALQLLSLLITVAVFFGAPRLRTPYDPYVLILIAALALGRGTLLPSRTRR
ncbi:MAG TPA: hypothetical protein VK034_14955, partial [Enhygromyxa sp.]|nr:hypothetical protein [Enhygromyxa sp.]